MTRFKSAGAMRAISVALLVAVSSPCLAQATKVPIRAAYVPVVTWLPAWVAKDTGLFDKHGLDVSLTLIQNLGLLPGTVGKQFDIAPSTPPDLINAAAKGLDVVAIAGGFLESSSRRSIEVIVRKDSGITKPQDLKGKLIASAAIGSLIHIGTLYWLKQNGVDPNSVRAVEVPFPNMGDQLKAGRIDAAESVQPFVGSLLAAGNVTIGDPVLAIADPVVGTLWIAEGKWARANLQVLKNWIAALTEAAERIKSDPTEARTILGKYSRLPEPVVQRIPIPDYQYQLQPKDLDSSIKMLRDLGQLTKPLDAATLTVTAP
jgi:NitT/TauT family transport system substrate-binding protein